MFFLSSNNIFITNDINEINYNLGEEIKILCEKSNLIGDYFFKLSLYLRSSQLQHNHYQQVKIFGEFCNLFKCKCLICDNSDNPFSMILVEGLNQYHTVSVNPNFLDCNIHIIE